MTFQEFRINVDSNQQPASMSVSEWMIQLYISYKTGLEVCPLMPKSTSGYRGIVELSRILIS